jgi:uncharacterized phage protein (TIGR01671 family)
MKREIKFRITYKNFDTSVMRYQFISIGQTIPHLGNEWIIKGEDQFTGLKDKNGKDICEGDVIRHGYVNHIGIFTEIGYIIYASDRAMFYVAKKGREQFNDCAITTKTISGKGKIFEVIGNIYENSELL